MIFHEIAKRYESNAIQNLPTNAKIPGARGHLSSASHEI
jgi:hypothetical protein